MNISDIAAWIAYGVAIMAVLELIFKWIGE